jgi:hypothetical protein
VFAVCFWLPLGVDRFKHAVLEALHLANWYAREHVLLCLIPAFFIAEAIGVFVRPSAGHEIPNLDYSRTSSRKCEACSRSTSCRGLTDTGVLKYVWDRQTRQVVEVEHDPHLQQMARE